MSVREAQRPLPTLTLWVPSEGHRGSQRWAHREEGRCSKELVRAPRGRDGGGSQGPPWQPNAGLWTKRPSTACGPPHLALPHPRADGGVGGAHSGSFGRQALGTRPQPRGPFGAPSLLLSWLPRFPPLGLSPFFLPLFPVLLCMASVITLPLSFSNVSETSLGLCSGLD